MIKLVKPSIEYEEKMISYVEEFKKENKIVAGGARIDSMPYKDWLIKLKNNESEDTTEDGFVPATTFIAVDEDDEVIGMIDIRHYLNDFLREIGGNIGYSVRKSKRGRGYATIILKLGIEEFKKISGKDCLVTCDKDNVASAKVILKNGGVLENEVEYEAVVKQRYWISV